MRRRRQRLRIRKRKWGRGIPYIYKSRVYIGQKPQTGYAAISPVESRLLENSGDVIGL